MIKTHIYGHHINLSSGLKNHLDKKIQKLSHHYDMLKIDFVLKKDGNNNVAEANTSLLGKKLNISIKDTDMYVAISKLIDRLDRILMRQKSKFNRKFKRGGYMHGIIH